jgi:predicted ester cyclase
MPTAAEEAAMGAVPAAGGGAAAAPVAGEAESVARAYFAAVAAKDPAAMAACWEPGGIDELHGVATLVAPDGVLGWFGEVFDAMPDFRMDVIEVLASGEKAAVHWHMTGTFTGPGRFEGLVPTGASIDLQGCDVLTVRNGLVQRNDAYVNGAEIARQLGVLPPRGSAQERAIVGATNAKTRAAGLFRRRGA